MSRRNRRRRRNPIDNKTLIYVGAGLAVLGVGWILYQGSQNPQPQALPAGPPASGGSVAGQAVAVGSAYAQCIAAGGNALSCLGQSTS
jgi:hypothetical protein